MVPSIWQEFLAAYLPEEPAAVLTIPLAEYRRILTQLVAIDPDCQLVMLSVASEAGSVGLRLVMRSQNMEPLALRFEIGPEEELDSILIPTISDLFAGAVWHEREAWDLWGVRFENHPDLRRILLPEEWEGHPLRPSYAIDAPCPPYRPVPELSHDDEDATGEPTPS